MKNLTYKEALTLQETNKRLREIVYNDTAVSVTVKAEDLRLLLEAHADMLKELKHAEVVYHKVDIQYCKDILSSVLDNYGR